MVHCVEYIMYRSVVSNLLVW